MLKNYLKIAYRNLLRNKVFSIINIVGLTAGTVCCLYILLYVKDQFGYDIYHPNAENIYRVRTHIDFNNDQSVFNSATSSPPVAPAMKRDFPEVEEYTRVLSFFTVKNNILGVVGKTETFSEEKGFLADSTFFKVFNFRFTEGSPEHALDAPYTVVLSSAVAKKLFGTEKALNKRIELRNENNPTTLTVTGVFDETYGKTHFHPRMLVSLNSGGLGEFVRNNEEWGGNNFLYSYVKLKPGSNPQNLQAKLPALLKRYGEARMKELGMQKQLFLQPIADIHLYSKGISNQTGNVSDITFLNMLLLIAAFIQLIACINFVNLTTARSVRRAKEVGIRKVIGAVRSSLIGQFLGESMLIAIISIVLALPILVVLLPLLNSLTNGSVSINFIENFDVTLIVIFIALFTGLLSGIYPALYLSNFKLISVLKGVFKFNLASVLLRKGLVVFQFSIAIALIIGVIIISRQLQFIQTRDLGFNEKQKIVIPLSNEQAQSRFAALKNELLTQKQVKNIGGARYYPTRPILQDMHLFVAGKSMNEGVLVKNNGVEQDFFKTMGIKLIAGRNFTPADTTNQIILNEKAVKDLGLNIATVVGSEIYGGSGEDKTAFKIIGVHKDYNNNSLKTGITPLFSYYLPQPENLIVDVQTDNYANFLANTEKIWKKITPEAPFSYSFLDEDLQKQYFQEESLKKIMNAFTGIAILISCLGLFGLATFTAEQRTKEIGIRKVLGASISNIIGLLSKDFMKLILISMLIAFPLGWYAMTQWLQDFAYKIDISWWIFALAGILALFIALLTVSFQAIRTALANPVKSLRTE